MLVKLLINVDVYLPDNSVMWPLCGTEWGYAICTGNMSIKMLSVDNILHDKSIINTPVYGYIFEHDDKITVHVVMRKDFFKIFWQFWSKCFRITRKYWRYAYLS